MKIGEWRGLPEHYRNLPGSASCSTGNQGNEASGVWFQLAPGPTDWKIPWNCNMWTGSTCCNVLKLSHPRISWDYHGLSFPNYSFHQSWIDKLDKFSIVKRCFKMFSAHQKPPPHGVEKLQARTPAKALLTSGHGSIEGHQARRPTWHSGLGRKRSDCAFKILQICFKSSIFIISKKFNHQPICHFI